MLHLLQDTASHAVQSSTPMTLGAAVNTLVIGAGTLMGAWLSHRAGKNGTEPAEGTPTLATIQASIAEIRAFVVGPDGENGLRGDVRELRKSVDGILERELTRNVGTYDRRSP